MATKKKTKTVDYWENSITAISGYPTVTTQNQSVIPPYEDTGVKFRGYAKAPVTGQTGTFVLKPQGTRFLSQELNNVAAGSHGYTRPNNTKNFYCTGIFIQYSPLGVCPFNIYISDIINGTANIRFVYTEYNPAVYQQGIFIDLSSCPRPFYGNGIDLYTSVNLGAGDRIHIEMFGFDEEK